MRACVVRSGERRERKGVVGGGAVRACVPPSRAVRGSVWSPDLGRLTRGGRQVGGCPRARAFLPPSLPLCLRRRRRRLAPARGLSLFPVRLSRSFTGVARVTSAAGGKRGERRVGLPAAALLPPLATRGRWRFGGGVVRVSSRWDPLPRLGAPAPTLSGYLAIAFRRVGLKTPGGVALSVPGVGGTAGARREPVSLRLPPLPRTAVPEAGRGLWGSGAPPRAPVGPVPRRPALPGAPTPGAGPVSLPSFPFSRPDPPSRSLCFCLVFHAGRPEATPLRSPLGVGGGTVPPSATCGSLSRIRKRSYDS